LEYERGKIMLIIILLLIIVCVLIGLSIYMKYIGSNIWGIPVIYAVLFFALVMFFYNRSYHLSKYSDKTTEEIFYTSGIKNE